MTPQRLGRLITVSTAALLALMLVGPGIATAATPGWQFRNILQEPTTVADGGVASFKFQVFNNGKSNISKLFLTDSYNGAALSVTNSRGVTCQTSPQLFCSFGALAAKGFINVQVLYRVGTSDFTTTFQLDSSGDPAGGNNSHGDSLLRTLTTFVNASAN